MQQRNLGRKRIRFNGKDVALVLNRGSSIIDSIMHDSNRLLSFFPLYHTANFIQVDEDCSIVQILSGCVTDSQMKI